MSTPVNDDLAARAQRYAQSHKLRIERPLGSGKDGAVFQTNGPTAIKVFVRTQTFNREKECYLRLTEMSVDEILGHAVPLLRRFDEELLIIEMSIVRPPFLLDFASAYLDDPPAFSEDVMHEWHVQKQFQFAHRWGHVQIILEVLKNTYGIYFLDATPGNIRFPEDDLP